MITADDLRAMLPPRTLAWLDAQHNPLPEVFPAVGRGVGRDPVADGWTTDEVVRALLLVGRPIEVITSLYRYGDAAEKLAVLRALDVAEVEAVAQGAAVPVLADAIRTNDPRLLAAALGPYATKWLPPASFRQAVLKCVFAGVPLRVVDGLPDRADAELRRMMADFAAERTAAGRMVPADLTRYLGPAAPGTDPTRGS